ncbi:uncharacterized protein LOC115627326 [Scaptodrosophila lebanonensis]|uniref:Uncharacterized protein LOC115627326 n=1 Tax=Drosophila lebanonensis TaxID=7225 RepID=A0A6J2TTC9_DROLE|nr:uncharacterized protein LOC115627326 [Scaptodrosophila lebanonensis]
MCWRISTHKLKLLVVVLTLIVAVDGMLKFSTNATLLLYYHNTRFLTFLIGRLVIGLLLSVWAFHGFIMLFYDSVRGVAIYSTGICLITVCDCVSLYYRFSMNLSTMPRVLDDDLMMARARSTEIHVLEEGIEDFLLVALIIVQIVVSIAGWWLAIRLRHHYEDEENYRRDQINLEQLRERSKVHH